MIFFNVSNSNRDRSTGQKPVPGNSVGQKHLFLEGGTLVAQSSSAWTDTAQRSWDEAVFSDCNNELSSYGKSWILGGEKAAGAWGVGTPKVPWASGRLEIQSVTLSLCLSALPNVCEWKNTHKKLEAEPLPGPGDSRDLWGVLNTWEKGDLKNRVDQVPDSPEKLVYVIIKDFQRPFFSVDVKT